MRGCLACAWSTVRVVYLLNWTDYSLLYVEAMMARTDKSNGLFGTREELESAVLAHTGTQSSAAKACGVSVATVSRIQNPPPVVASRLNLDDYWRVAK